MQSPPASAWCPVFIHHPGLAVSILHYQERAQPGAQLVPRERRERCGVRVRLEELPGCATQCPLWLRQISEDTSGLLVSTPLYTSMRRQRHPGAHEACAQHVANLAAHLCGSRTSRICTAGTTICSTACGVFGRQCCSYSSSLALAILSPREVWCENSVRAKATLRRSFRKNCPAAIERLRTRRRRPCRLLEAQTSSPQNRATWLSLGLLWLWWFVVVFVVVVLTPLEHEGIYPACTNAPNYGRPCPCGRDLSRPVRVYKAPPKSTSQLWQAPRP